MTQSGGGNVNLWTEKNPHIKKESFLLDESEQLNEIVLRHGAVIDSMTIITRINHLNLKKYGPFGGSGGTHSLTLKGENLQNIEIASKLHDGVEMVKSLNPSWS